MCARKLLLASLLWGGVVLPSSAKDLGVLGTVWPITEVDIRQVLMQGVADVDWSAVQNQVRQQAEAYPDQLPRRTLGRAEHTQTAWVDPSITVSSDIQAPVPAANGEYQWQTVLPAGTRVNPLRQFRPVTGLLFFNSSAEDELALARALVAERPHDIKLVEASGANPARLTKDLGALVFAATEPMLKRFGVTHTPTLLHTGTGANEFHVGVTVFAPPFTTAAVAHAWASPLTITDAPRTSDAGAPTPAREVVNAPAQ